MNVLLFAVGAVVVVITSVDLLWTALWVDGGAGPISRRVTAQTWRAFLRIDARWPGRRGSRFLRFAGPSLLVLTLVLWVCFLWLGWTLVFAAGDPAIVNTQADRPIDWSDRIYFTAYTIVTLGMGDFVPTSGRWQIVTTLATASGILFLTLAVSYVLSVVEAVVEKRTFAGEVSGLGADVETFVLAGWNGEDFTALDPALSTIATQLDQLAEQHGAYPILHYYHTANPRRSAALAAAIVDESVTTLRHGVPAEQRPNPALLRTLRASSEAYVGTLSGSVGPSVEDAPPAPDITRLREAGVPVVEEKTFEGAIEGLDAHRRMLRALVVSDGWEWREVHEDGTGIEDTDR